MSEKNSVGPANLMIISDNDPLGIKDVSLGGDPPSLVVEAIIAKRQYEGNGRHNSKEELDGQPEGKS